MSPARRIFLNIVATYGRSLYGLLLGLFTSRWALESLGQSDFGLFGLVGGMIAAVTILNTQMAAAVGRFYAVCVGEAKLSPKSGMEKCRQWFTTAVVIHTILPLGLIIVGYPIGEWVVRHFLTIPPDRVVACVWVWRFAVVSAFVGMMNVPFGAMYTAKQEIAELTIYSFVSTTLRAVLLFYMVNHPGDWLSKYAFWMCLIAVGPQILICLRAKFAFPECRLELKYVRCWPRVVQLVKYAGWQAFGGIGWLVREQGNSILINKYFGPKVNAAMTIGTTLSGHCNTLSSSMVGALSPAIMNAYGAGRLDQVRNLALRACKVAAIGILIFAIPLVLEVDEVLLLWLKNPPRYSAGFCYCVLATEWVDKLVCGHMIAINATGQVSRCMAVFGGLLFLTFPVAWLWLICGGNVYTVGWAMIVMIGASAVVRVRFARTLVCMDVFRWVRTIVAPIMLVMMLCFAVGAVPRFLLLPSLGRVCLTTIVVEAVFLPCAWLFLLEPQEREYIAQRFRKKGRI